MKPDDKNKRGGGGVEEALRSLSHGSGCFERTSSKTQRPSSRYTKTHSIETSFHNSRVSRSEISVLNT